MTAPPPRSPGGVSDCSGDDSVARSDTGLSLAGKALPSSFLTEEDQPAPAPPVPRAFLPASASAQLYRDAFSLSRSAPGLRDAGGGGDDDDDDDDDEEEPPPPPPPPGGEGDDDASSAALDAALRAARARAFLDDSSSGLVRRSRSSDSLAEFGGCGLRRKLSWKLGGRRHTEQRSGAASPLKSVRWAHSTSSARRASPERTTRFAGSRSMPDAIGIDDDVAERRARAQFARSRNHARIWGSARSNGSVGSMEAAEGSAEFSRPVRRAPPTMRGALQVVLPCARDESYFAVVCGVAAALTAVPEARGHCEALLRAGALFNESVRDEVEKWPPQKPAPKVVSRSKGVYFAAAMPFGEAVAVVAAVLAMHGMVAVKRKAHRAGRRLVVSIVLRAEGGGMAARAEIAERGEDSGVVDVGIVRAENVLRKFSSKRRDAFVAFRDEVAKVWASVGVAAAEADGELSSSRLLRGGGASWRRRNTSLV